jgi:toxin ParE1/3/4
MLNLEWRETALDDLDQIITYIGQRNIAAAEAMRDLADEAAQRIALFPLSYRTGRMPGTREAVIHPNYMLVYRVGSDAVEIVDVLHARQQYP